METIAKFIIWLGIVLITGLLLALLIMPLWNAIIPDLLGLPTIGYWQSVCLYFFVSLLFRSSTDVKIK